MTLHIVEFSESETILNIILKKTDIHEAIRRFKMSGKFRDLKGNDLQGKRVRLMTMREVVWSYDPH